MKNMLCRVIEGDAKNVKQDKTMKITPNRLEKRNTWKKILNKKLQHLKVIE